MIVTENQISQVNLALFYAGKISQGSLKAFLWYAPRQCGAGILCFSHPELPWGTMWAVAAVWWLPAGRYSFLPEFPQAHIGGVPSLMTVTSLFTDVRGNIPLLILTMAMPDISSESSTADCTMLGFPRVASGKKIHLPMQEKWVQSLGWEDPLEEECGNPLQFSCLENSMDRGAWRATIHKVATEQLSTLTQALSNMWRNTNQFISIWLNQFSHGPCTVIWNQAVSRRAWCGRAEEHPIYKR